MKLMLHKYMPLSVVLFVGLFFVNVFFMSNPAHADAISGKDGDPGIEELTDRWLRYRAIARCYAGHDVKGVNIDFVVTGYWFGGDTAIGYLEPDNGKVRCGDGGMVTNSIEKIGFASNQESFCAMRTALRDGKKGFDNCMTGSGELDMNGSKTDQFNAFKDAKGAKVSDSAVIPYEGDGTGKFYYWLGLQSLKKFCGGERGEKYENSMAGNVGDSKRKVVVNEINPATGAIERYVYDLDRDEDETQNDVYARQTDTRDMKCTEMAQLTWQYDESFASFVKQYNSRNPDDVNIGSDNDGNSPSGDETTCAIDGIGWIVCPVFDVMSRVVDETYKVVEKLLIVEPLTTNADNSSLYSAWGVMRNFANVCFVIAFMVIIYSQLTGAGISNYGIKKLLPRIILAALLVNVSFWICAIAVDLSNIIGTSIKNLFDAAGNTIETPKLGNFATSEGGWQGITGVILAGALVGVGLYLGLAGLIIMLPTALLAIITAFLVLTLRQALIIILICVSPLAFVAYLLPNTEDWFKKWFGLLKTMLLMFPIIAVVFGGSALASQIIMTSSDDFMVQLMGAGVAIIPLAITPIIMKTAGGILNRFGGFINNPNRGPFDALKKRAEATAGRIRNNRDIRAVNKSGIGRGSVFRRRRLASGQKLEAIQKQRDADVDSFGNTNTGVRKYRSRAINAQETAKATGTELENEVKKKHLEANIDLHGRVITTGLDLKNAEETHRNETEAEHMRQKPTQYQSLKGSQADKQNAGLEVDRNFERSMLGQAYAQQRQGLEGQVDTAKQKQKEDYLNSTKGGVIEQQRRVATKGAQLADSRVENVYLESQEGHAQGQEERVLRDDKKLTEVGHDVAYEDSAEGQAYATALGKQEGELEIKRGDNKELWEGSLEGQAQAVRKDAVQKQAKITQNVAATQAAKANEDLHVEVLKTSDQEKVAEMDTKQEYETSDDGKAMADALAATGKRASITTKRAEARFTQSDPGKALGLEDAAATGTAAAEQASLDATAEELRSQAGLQDRINKGLATPEEIAFAPELQAAAEQARVQGQRKATASEEATTEYARKITEDADLASKAGGISEYGAQRAVAAAQQTLDAQLQTVVRDEKVTQESTPGSELAESVVTGENKKGEKVSLAYRMAAAGTVAARGNMGDKLKLLKATGPELAKARAEARATAEAAGLEGDAIDKAINEDPEVEAIRFAQKQIFGDMKEWPFAAGDTMKDQLALGDYEGDLDTDLSSRITDKFNSGVLTRIKKEEVDDIGALGINDEQRAVIQRSINDAANTPQIRRDVKPEIWARLRDQGYSIPDTVLPSS